MRHRPKEPLAGRPRLLPRQAALIVLALAFATLASAQDDAARHEQEAKRLVAIQDADPLELARVTAALGDLVLLDLLAETQPADVRLAATRSTPWMRAPELSLEALAQLAKGSDPDLAPAAMLAAHRIATSLDADAIVARESEPEALSKAATRFEELSADESARADLRQLARFTAATIRDLFSAKPKP